VAGRTEQIFPHVPLDAHEDTNVTIRPRGTGIYELSPYPFAAEGAEFAFAGRPITPGPHDGGWTSVLRETPTQWERFCFVAG